MDLQWSYNSAQHHFRNCINIEARTGRKTVVVLKAKIWGRTSLGEEPRWECTDRWGYILNTETQNNLILLVQEKVLMVL